MADYFLRFKESDLPAVRQLGILLGELYDTDDGSLVGNGFVMIGNLTEPTGETITDDDGNTVELRRVITDPNGNPYIHANLRTDQDLRAVAESLVAEHPEMAGALADLGRFFLLDDHGNARAPNSPQQVFF